ncbi:glutathione S-transferase C-terminal domain-containing protein [Kaistia dalseonensis]|uniref:glutathione S-transferase C-terminal domain-containing protein n=1 Tax=Kaistia dalseonensis TaxID=410840 RepID=UPI00225049A3|nr:glutathione S-transferase C-terminal domain-containing protein [Kaistia dalseonensis]
MSSTVGEVLTENIAILDWLAAEYPVLGVAGPLGRTRLIEALAFVSTEIHRSFKPMWHAATDAERSRASAQISALLNQISDTLAGAYLFGDRPSVADFYLFVMLLWAKRFDVETPGRLTSLRERLIRRPAVEAALRHEGLLAALVE